MVAMLMVVLQASEPVCGTAGNPCFTLPAVEVLEFTDAGSTIRAVPANTYCTVDNGDAMRAYDACDATLKKTQTALRTTSMALLIAALALLAVLGVLGLSRRPVHDAFVRSEWKLPPSIRALAYIFVTPMVAVGVMGCMIRFGTWLSDDHLPASPLTYVLLAVGGAGGIALGLVFGLDVYEGKK